MMFHLSLFSIAFIFVYILQKEKIEVHQSRFVSLLVYALCDSVAVRKGPFTQAIFVAATQCNFSRAEVATSISHV